MPNKRRLLLTGGTGMVGRNILEHPNIVEWDVLAPAREELDLTDIVAIEKLIKDGEPDAVIHTAGLVGGIQANILRPREFLIDNVDIGRNVVLASEKAGVTKLINLASSCMYPKEAVNPLTEEMILTGELEPTNEAYALAKIVVAKLCQYVGHANSHLQYKTLIPCNLYGRYDTFSSDYSHLIPSIIDKIHKAKCTNKQLVEIWGDGTARREFMYARDMADAILNALKDLDNVPDLMNIGVGRDYSVNEYYQMVADVLGWKGEFVHDLSQPAGMAQKLVSIEKQNCWGWRPSIPLSRGIEETYKYYLESGC